MGGRARGPGELAVEVEGAREREEGRRRGGLRGNGEEGLGSEEEEVVKLVL